MAARQKSPGWFYPEAGGTCWKLLEPHPAALKGAQHLVSGW